MEAQASESPDSVYELLKQQKESSKDYLLKLREAIEKGKEQYQSEEFIFIEGFTRQDKIMIRSTVTDFFPRITCPTPSFNQVVYRYVMKEDIIEYVWQIPSNKRCLQLLANPLAKSEGERLLIEHVHDLRDGTLEKLTRFLNKEEYQAGLAFVQDDNPGDIYVG